MAEKRIVLVALECETAEVLYHSLAQQFHISSVIFEKKENRFTFLRRRWRRQGFRAVVGQVLFQLIIPTLLKPFSQKRIEEIRKNNNLTGGPIPEQLIVRVDSVNHPKTSGILREARPDAIVLHGTRIVSKATLEAVKCPWINIHAGVTPQYRGSHGGYWALYRNRPLECGVTVHLVDTGIDTGNILAQGIIKPHGDNILTYPWLQLSLGISLLKTELVKVLEGNSVLLPSIEAKSELFYNPTLFQYIKGLSRGVF